MALVDRKVSLPNDYDIKVAYIYPVTLESLERDATEEEVRFLMPFREYIICFV